MSARFLRQALLPEIGEEGQRRIGAAAAAVGGEGLACEIAARYAAGAGFGAITPATPAAVDVEALAPASVVTAKAAREVLAGARAALAEMRRVVEMGAPPPNPRPSRVAWPPDPLGGGASGLGAGKPGGVAS